MFNSWSNNFANEIIITRLLERHAANPIGWRRNALRHALLTRIGFCTAGQRRKLELQAVYKQSRECVCVLLLPLKSRELLRRQLLDFVSWRSRISQWKRVQSQRRRRLSRTVNACVFLLVVWLCTKSRKLRVASSDSKAKRRGNLLRIGQKGPQWRDKGCSRNHTN